MIYWLANQQAATNAICTDLKKRLDVGVLPQVYLFAQINQRNGISKLCKFPRYITAWIAARINEGK